MSIFVLNTANYSSFLFFSFLFFFTLKKIFFGGFFCCFLLFFVAFFFVVFFGGGGGGGGGFSLICLFHFYIFSWCSNAPYPSLLFIHSIGIPVFLGVSHIMMMPICYWFFSDSTFSRNS